MTIKRPQRRSLYIYFLTLVLVVLIPFALLFITYNYTIRATIMEDYVSLNERVVASVCKKVDANIAAHMSFAYSAGSNTAVKKLAARAEDSALDSWLTYQEVYGLMRFAHMFDNTFPLTAIWFIERDLVISTHTPTLTANEFYERYVGLVGVTGYEFYAQIRADRKQKFHPCSAYSTTIGDSGECLLFTKEVDMGYLKPRAMFITTIDKKALTDALLGGFAPGASMRLVSDDGVELAAFGALSEDPDWSAGWAERDGALIRSRDGVEYQVFESAGAQTRLKYIYYVPYTAVLLRMRLFRNIWIGAALVCLLIGAGIARLIAGRLHAQMRKLLVAAFPSGDSPVPTNMGEGFRIVANQMEQTYLLNAQIQEKLKEYYMDARNNTLLRLLSQSRHMTDEELEEAAEICRLPLGEYVYQVAVLKSLGGGEPSVSWFKEGERGDATILCAQLSAGQTVYVIARSAEIGDVEPLFPERAEGCAVGLSRVHLSVRDLQRLMSEASAACKIPDEQGKPVLFSELAADLDAIHYPLEKEMRIIAAVREGSFSDARILLADILEFNNTQRQLLPEMRLCLYHNMIATALKASEILGSRLEVIEQGMQALDMLRDHRLAEGKTFAEVLLVYQRLCDETKKVIKSKNHHIIENVSAYLSENFARADMCLDVVAEQLDVSYYFLSRIFKEEAKRSFSDMLNDARVNRAKELLRTTKLPVQTICENVGYTNWTTFLRAFRKNTGTTPAQYRSAQGT